MADETSDTPDIIDIQVDLPRDEALSPVLEMPAPRQLPPHTAPALIFDEAPWERQPKENPRAFHAFTHYRDLGYARSLDKAYRAHRTGCDKTPIDSKTRATKQWNEWNRDNQWQWRIDQWDRHQDKELRDSNAKELREVLQRHAKVSQATLTALSVPTRAILEVLQKTSALESLVALAQDNPRELLKLIGYATRAAQSMPGVVTVERLALGLNSEQVGVQEVETVDVLEARRKVLMLLERVASVR